jgi:hypothetical protein
MPAEFTLALAAKNAMATQVRTLIDAGGAAGKMELQTSANAVLATATLAYPCGVVDTGDGVLDFTATAQATATATGTIAKAVFKTSANAEVFTSNVSDKSGSAFVRLDTLTISSVGQPVQITVGEMSY